MIAGKGRTNVGIGRMQMRRGRYGVKSVRRIMQGQPPFERLTTRYILKSMPRAPLGDRPLCPRGGL